MSPNVEFTDTADVEFTDTIDVEWESDADTIVSVPVPGQTRTLTLDNAIRTFTFDNSVRVMNIN